MEYRHPSKHKGRRKASRRFLPRMVSVRRVELLIGTVRSFKADRNTDVTPVRVHVERYHLPFNLWRSEQELTRRPAQRFDMKKDFGWKTKEWLPMLKWSNLRRRCWRVTIRSWKRSSS